jgi:hypothetical protein
MEASLVETQHECRNDSTQECADAFDEYWGQAAPVPVTIFGQVAFVPPTAGTADGSSVPCKYSYRQHRTTPSPESTWPPSLLTAFESLLHAELATITKARGGEQDSGFQRKDHQPWQSVKGWDSGLAWTAFGRLMEVTLQDVAVGGAGEGATAVGVSVPREWLAEGDFVSLEGHAHVAASGAQEMRGSRSTAAAFLEITPLSDTVDEEFKRTLMNEWRAQREGRRLGDEVLSECQCRRLLSMVAMPLWKSAAPTWAGMVSDIDPQADGVDASPAMLLPMGRLKHLVRTCRARMSS